MDFTLYWFMFPASILVSTIAAISGIGGAALFMPIFLLIFPALGPEYPLSTPVEAIAVALLTQLFGFGSGFVGYFRRGLIDFGLTVKFLWFSIPAAVLGALVSQLVSATHIRLTYGLMMAAMSFLIFSRIGTRSNSETDDMQGSGKALRTRTDVRGVTYRYRLYKAKPGPTSIGGFLTGMLSTGIGEVVMPQLINQGRIPVPVAAASSLVVLILTVVSASFVHVTTLVSQGGLAAIPWHLVIYTIPGVVIGGQLGPRLQGRVRDVVMKRAIGVVFAIIAFAMLWTVFGASH
jgi:uncharacterized membrane protein YfcA